MATTLLIFRIFRRCGIFLFLLASALGRADAEERDRTYGLLFEGFFEKADIVSKIEGARKTQLAAAYTWKYGVRLFTDESWQEIGLEWENFAIRAGVKADRLASEIEPGFVRDHRGVIQYAVVSDEDPFLSSAITSPKFVDPFIDTLGEKLHVIVLDRHVLYVFPAAGSSLADFGPSLVRLFKNTPLPVSLEIFEVTKNSCRVVGEIES